MTAAREGQAASRSGSGLGRAAEGGVEVGVGGGGVVGSGAASRACGERRESARWPTAMLMTATAEEFDLGEVAVGKNEPRG